MFSKTDREALRLHIIDEQKKVQGKLEDAIRDVEQAKALVRSVFDMSRDPMAVLDSKNRVIIPTSPMASSTAPPADSIMALERLSNCLRASAMSMAFSIA